MANGRTQEIADRNCKIKRYWRTGNYTLISLGTHFGISAQTVHKIVHDPNSHKVTVKPPTRLVRLLEDHDPNDPTPHGTRSGYELWGCRCGDCQEAKAISQRHYEARKRNRTRSEAS